MLYGQLMNRSKLLALVKCNMNIKIVILLIMASHYVSASQHNGDVCDKMQLWLGDDNSSIIAVLPDDVKKIVAVDFYKKVCSDKPFWASQGSGVEFIRLKKNEKETLVRIFDVFKKQDDEGAILMAESKDRQFLQDLQESEPSLWESMLDNLPNQLRRRYYSNSHAIYVKKPSTNIKSSIFIPNSDDRSSMMDSGIKFGGCGAIIGSIVSCFGSFNIVGYIAAPLFIKITLPAAVVGGTVGCVIGIINAYINNVMHRKESNVCGNLSGYIKIPKISSE